MEWNVATPEGTAKFEDPAGSEANEEAESKPLGKRPHEMQINTVKLSIEKAALKSHITTFKDSSLSITP